MLASGLNSRAKRSVPTRTPEATIDNNIVYTLYRCTAYQGDAYRVNIANESDPGEPDYMLHPVRWDPRDGGGRPDFSEVWYQEDIAEKFPLFVKDMEDYLETLPVDPS
jgi:hypothetical protein